MKTYLLIASAALLATLSTASLPANAKTMKECAAQWQEMKAANQTAGMKYRDFTKQCMTGEAAPAAGTAPAAPPPSAAKPAPAAEKPTAGAAPAAQPEGKHGREAMIARERACG